ncbi:MAG: MATE family efflux transporter [Saprospiraceae bacterium]|jgi:putative MATE family efflux protein|nr:MATE family efflux transporter [Saprospiraceae bacterium]MDP4998134.1 MATE family efflux transporter [Saprospiraceae bacterium]
MSQSSALGSKPVGKLLVGQAVPASIGFLVMSIYGIVDTIFVGKWVGSLAIAAITVVIPISFLISSIGMAIGIGGASVISRSLGSDNKPKALLAFGNQIALTISLAVIIMILGFCFQAPILKLFGGRGDILAPASVYFRGILLGIPFLAWAMMSNNVMRALGAPKMAMFVLLVPAVLNIILDPIFIVAFDWGLAGAAWATAFSYVASAGFAVWFFFFSGRSELRITPVQLILKWSMVREIFSIGIVTLARQGTISLLAIVLNNSLFTYGGELAVSVYGIINRMMMLVNFPVIGITQGFIPIAGYNYGAKQWSRVRAVIRLAIRYGTGIASLLCIGILIFAHLLANIFTNDAALMDASPMAIRIAFMATPFITLQLISSAYFQAIGKPIPALLLTLTKQGFFLIPLILILPGFWGLNGIWIAFPIADTLSAVFCYYFLIREANRTLQVADQ